jgi:hypothetical protein
MISSAVNTGAPFKRLINSDLRVHRKILCALSGEAKPQERRERWKQLKSCPVLI